MSELATEQVKRGPGRPPMREKEEMRASEDVKRLPLRDRLRSTERLDKITDDKFFIPPHMIPDGVSLEWKRYSIKGMEDPYYLASLQRQGWEVMVAEDFPGLVPNGHKGPIIKEGMVLMGRRAELTNAAVAEMKRTAQEQMAIQHKRLHEAPQGTGPRNEPGVRPSVTTEVGRMVSVNVEE